jgi:hypothetical protein
MADQSVDSNADMAALQELDEVLSTTPNDDVLGVADNGDTIATEALQELDEVLSTAHDDTRPMGSNRTAIQEVALSEKIVDNSPKYLELIVNVEARAFWADHIGHKRVHVDQLLLILTDWLKHECTDVQLIPGAVARIESLLKNNDAEYVSYTAFNRFSILVQPFIPDVVCETFHSDTSTDDTAIHSESALTTKGGHNVDSGAQNRTRRRQARELRYLNLIVNEKARLFWKERVAAKSIDLDAWLRCVKQWLIDAGIMQQTCHAVVESFRQIYSAQTEISYTDYNMLTLELVPFAPAEICPIVMSAPYRHAHNLSRSGNSSETSVAIKVIQCVDLISADKNGASDPFVRIYVSGLDKGHKSTWETTVEKATLSPIFNEMFFFTMKQTNDVKALVTVWDHDLIGRNQLLGQAEINLFSFFESQHSAADSNLQLRLEDPTGRVAKHKGWSQPQAENAVYGSIALQINFLEPGHRNTDGNTAIIKTGTATVHAANEQEMVDLASLNELDMQDDSAIMSTNPAVEAPSVNPSTNESAQQFWERYIGEQRILCGHFMDLFEAWLLKGGIAIKEASLLTKTLQNKLPADTNDSVSYSEFCRFSGDIFPFSPNTVRAALVENFHPATASSQNAYLDFIADDTAREFWVRYMGGNKRIALDEGAEMLEGWFLKAGISVNECEVMIEKCKLVLDHQRTTFITYSAFNKFSLAINPFTPHQAYRVLLNESFGLQHRLKGVAERSKPRHVNSLGTAPNRPAYLELIVNQGARQFWEHYVAEMRTTGSHVTGALDAWLLKEGVPTKERCSVILAAERQLSSGDGYMSYAEFNSFSVDMMPFIASRICEVVLANASVTGSSHTHADTGSESGKSGNMQWIQLVTNIGAREFWLHYVGEKRAETTDTLGTLEAWLRSGGVTKLDCQAIIGRAREFMDGNNDGSISFSDFNSFTKFILPFTPENVRAFVLATHDDALISEPEREITESPHSLIGANSEANAPNVRSVEEHEHGASMQTSVTVISAKQDSNGDSTHQHSAAEDTQAPVGQSIDILARLQQFIKSGPKVPAHITPGSRWWQEIVNNMQVARKSQVHREVNMLSDETIIQTICGNGSPVIVSKVAVRSMLREARVSGRLSNDAVVEAFASPKTGKINKLELACSLLFLCKKDYETIMNLSFRVLQNGNGGNLARADFAIWVASISKMARMCAIGCCPIFNELCGGVYEPSKESKHVEFNHIVMQSARARMKEVETQLLSRFESNVGQASGMKSKFFSSWMGQLKSINMWLIGLSEEWRNLIDHQQVFFVPKINLKATISSLLSAFGAAGSANSLSPPRVAECLMKFGLKTQSVIQLITKIFDIKASGKISRPDVLIGLSLICGDGAEKKLQTVFQVYNLSTSGSAVTTQSVYKAMRAYTMIAIHIASVIMHNCSIFEKDTKLQDTVSRIINARASVYLSYVSVCIVDYMQIAEGHQKIDFEDLRRFLDYRAGISDWLSFIGQRMVFVLGLDNLSSLVSVSDDAAQTWDKTKGPPSANGKLANFSRSYDADDGIAEEIRCTECNSVWSMCLVFCASIIPRSNRRPPSVFDSLTLDDAKTVLRMQSITQQTLDELLQRLYIQSHHISEKLHKMSRQMSREQSSSLACAFVSLRKTNGKQRLADIFDILTGQDSKIVWSRIAVWLESMIQVSEDVASYINHRILDLCSGHRKMSRDDAKNNLLGSQILRSVRKFMTSCLVGLQKSYTKEVHQQRLGSAQPSATADGLTDREFVQWMSAKRGVVKAVDAWLQTAGGCWLQQLCEIEQCVKDVVAEPTSVQRLAVAKVSSTWSTIEISDIHNAFGLDGFDGNSETLMLRSVHRKLDSLALSEGLQKLGFPRIAAERLSLLFDTDGSGEVELRDILVVLYFVCGRTVEDRIDRGLHLFGLGSLDKRMPATAYDFFRPFIVVALDTTEGLSAAMADLFGRDHNAKRMILMCTHRDICEYAGQMANGLTSYLKLHASSATPSAIRRFLDEKFDFMQWMTDLRNEWILHMEKFSELKPGMVLRKELVSFIKYTNQFETVVEGSWWWSKVVTNRLHHTSLSSAFTDLYHHEAFHDCRFEISTIRKLQKEMMGVSVEFEDLQDAMQDAGIARSEDGRQLYLTFRAGRNTATDMVSLGCGCLIFENGDLRNKFNRLASFLQNEATGAIRLQETKKMMTTVLTIGTYVIDQMNTTVGHLCGGDHEPQAGSKREQFQNLTLDDARTKLADVTNSCMTHLQSVSQAELKPQTFSEILAADQPFKSVVTRLSAWWRYSIQFGAALDMASSSIPSVSQRTAGYTIDVIRPIVTKYMKRSSSTGKKLILELSKALDLSTAMRECLHTLLLRDESETVDVKECAITFALLCGANNATEKFAFAVELFGLDQLKRANDEYHLAFVIQTYGMLRPFWMVAMHVASSFLRAYHNCFGSQPKIINALLQIVSLRVGLYLDTIVLGLQQSVENMLDDEWQEPLSQSTGHLLWLSRLCGSFADSIAGLLENRSGIGATMPVPDSVHLVQRSGLTTQPDTPENSASLSAIPNPSGAIPPGQNYPELKMESYMQKGKKAKERWYVLQDIDGQGICLCKYSDERDAESVVPKSPLPLYCISKIMRLQPDVTEYVTYEGQTNRFRILHSAKNASDVDELRCDSSPEALQWMDALEMRMPSMTGIMEILKNPTEQDLSSGKWVKRYFVLQLRQFLWFEGTDASSLRPAGGPVCPSRYRIAGASEVRDWAPIGSPIGNYADATCLQLHIGGQYPLSIRSTSQNLGKWVAGIQKAFKPCRE